MHRILPSVLTAAVGLSACSGGSTPTMPTPPPTPTVTVLTIGGAPASMLTGQSATLAANASYSNGTSQPVAATWQSDSPAITVDSSGRVTAAANGTATITARYQSAVATAIIQSITNYQGSWSGTYINAVCDASGMFASMGFCAPLVGVTAPVLLSLAQTSTTVSGTITFGNVQGNIVAASVRGDGHLTMNPQWQVVIGGTAGTLTVTVSDWDTVASSKSMTGTWVENWRATGWTGNAVFQRRLVSMTRTSAALAARE